MPLRTEQANEWPLVSESHGGGCMLECAQEQNFAVMMCMTWVKCGRDSRNLGRAGELSDCAGETLCLPTDVIRLQGM